MGHTSHYPVHVCASGVKQSILCVRPSVFITGIAESKTTFKWKENEEIRRIIANVYLVEHKAVLFLAFSTFFGLSMSSTILFNMAMGTPTVCWVRSGYAMAVYVIRRTKTESRETEGSTGPYNRGPYRSNSL